MKPEIRELQTVLHLSLAKQHQLKQCGTIHAPEHWLHGKKLCIETITPKSKNGNFRKAKQFFYLDEKDSPEFTSVKSFAEHYKIKI